MNYLIVGLGNPGAEYADTRHNFGFAVADFLAKKFAATKVKTKLPADVSRARNGDDDIFILKPGTFMNLSGNAVVPFAKTKKIPMKNIIVIHDELDLPLGVLRLSVNAGPAGHNGVRSLIASFGGKDFARLRLGIGPRPDAIPADKFVLGKFSSEEKEQLPKIIDQAAATVANFFAAGAKNNVGISDQKNIQE